MFTAVTDYTPSVEDAGDHLPLKEGQQVQILDDANPDLWLCRLLESPDKKVSECYIITNCVKISIKYGIYLHLEKTGTPSPKQYNFSEK